MVEAKATVSARPQFGDAVGRLIAAARGRESRGFVVHRPKASGEPLHALRPGVQAVSLSELLGALAGR